MTAALVDPAVVGQFLSRVFEFTDEGVISLLGIGEKGTPQEGIYKKRVFTSQDQSSVIIDWIAKWADSNVAAFFVPAAIKPSAVIAGDVKEDKIAAFTSIVLDLDTGDVDAKAKYVADRMGEPTIVVMSGGQTAEGKDKRHLYWCLDEPTEEVERVGKLRKLLAQKVGGDPSFGRVTQVVRIAGSVHCKHGKATPVRLAECNDRAYGLEDLAEIIETMIPMPGCETPQAQMTMYGGPAGGGMMDFAPRQDTAQAALHRDIHEGGTDLTRWGEFSKVAGFAIREAREGRMSPAQAAEHAHGWMLSHMIPPWPEQRFQQEFLGLWRADLEKHGSMPAPPAPTVSLTDGRVIEPTPATFPLASVIAPREFIAGRWLIRGKLTGIIAPGGVGKSSLVALMQLSLAANRPLFGKEIHGGPHVTWGLNLEDDLDDLARSRIATMRRHGVSEAECGGRMYVDSGPDGTTICLAYEDRVGFHLNMIDFDALERAIISRQVSVLFIDPFVSSHQIDENDNGRIDALVKGLAGVARRTNCAIVLVHHSRKLNGERVNVDSARGAGALANAARIVLVLNRMTFEQAEAWGLEPHTAAQYFSVGDDKHNLSAAEMADWFKIEGVSLDNGNEHYPADSVGVVVPWTPPKAMDGVGASDLYQVQKVIAAGRYRYDSQVTKEPWVGEPVSNILRIALDDAGKKRVKAILKTWIKSGALKVYEDHEPGRQQLKNYVGVGQWVVDPNHSDLSTERN